MLKTTIACCMCCFKKKQKDLLIYSDADSYDPSQCTYEDLSCPKLVKLIEPL